MWGGAKTAAHRAATRPRAGRARAPAAAPALRRSSDMAGQLECAGFFGGLHFGGRDVEVTFVVVRREELVEPIFILELSEAINTEPVPVFHKVDAVPGTGR